MNSAAGGLVVYILTQALASELSPSGFKLH